MQLAWLRPFAFAIVVAATALRGAGALNDAAVSRECAVEACKDGAARVAFASEGDDGAIGLLQRRMATARVIAFPWIVDPEKVWQEFRAAAHIDEFETAIKRIRNGVGFGAANATKDMAKVTEKVGEQERQLTQLTEQLNALKAVHPMATALKTVYAAQWDSVTATVKSTQGVSFKPQKDVDEDLGADADGLGTDAAPDMANQIEETKLHPESVWNQLRAFGIPLPEYDAVDNLNNLTHTAVHGAGNVVDGAWEDATMAMRSAWDGAVGAVAGAFG